MLYCFTLYSKCILSCCLFSEHIVIAVLFDVFSVFIYSHCQERNNNNDNAEITTVAITVFDNIRQSCQWNGHGQNNNKSGYNGASDRCRLDAWKNLQLLKTCDKTENRCNTCRNQTQQQTHAINGCQPVNIHSIAGCQCRNNCAAIHTCINIFPCQQHKYR